MSYILEALRKSERERQLKQSPSLTSVVAEPPQARRQWLPWLVVAVLVIANAGALIYFLTKRDAPSQPAAGDGKVAVPAALPAPPVAIRPPAVPQPATSVQPADVPAPVKADVPAVAPPVPQVVAVPPPPREPAAERLPASPPPQAEEKPSRRKTPSEPARGKPDEAEEPEGKSSYRINVLAFDPDPDQRFAIINMTKYFKGDSLPDGAVVEDIEAGAVVLSRRGKRIRIAH